MRKAGLRDAARYLDRLDADPAVLEALLAELLTGETYFFREPGQFEQIRTRVLPSVLAPDRPLRIWSAGCSTGEEAYSLAILAEQEAMPARICGTDLSPDFVARARDGVYGDWSFRGVPAAVRDRYFRPSGTQFRIAPRLRGQVRFETLNLAHDIPGFVAENGPFDLILCRNVLIYLDPAAARQVMADLAAGLGERGWLVLGPSDPLLPDEARLQTVATEAGLFYRHDAAGDRAMRPAPQMTAPLSGPHRMTALGLLPAPIPKAAPQPAAIGIAEAAGQIRARARDGDLPGAAAVAAELAERYSLSAELQFLHGVLLAELAGSRTPRRCCAA